MLKGMHLPPLQNEHDIKMAFALSIHSSKENENVWDLAPTSIFSQSFLRRPDEFI